ncbi:integrase catalytic domain-containing protein [Trichonephila clavipes]|nr:integrase catalytic domain-containing protein [Trichonephila clavipes]
MPTFKWPLGRITEIYSGSDALIRVVKIEKQLELEKVRKESEKNPQTLESGEPSSITDKLESLVKSIKTLTIQVPVRSESFNLFFHSLEKAFQIKSVPEELKPEILLNILGERVNNLLTYVSQEDLSNYVKIKELMLREFEPTPQECLSNFKKARKLPSENYVQFASRLSATFDYYCQLRKVNEFRSLCDLIISDKIFETLDRDTRNHIATKQGETYFKPQQLGRECNVYLSARGNVSNDLMSRNPGSGVKTDGRNRLQMVGTWRRERNSSNVFVAETKTNCVLCEEILTYRLKTVTYGLSNAPFLAIRTLQQLAKDEKSRFPLASETLLYNTYMDDIVSGAPDLETAQQLQSQLKDALQSCGMNLHKWSSNSPELLNSPLSSDVEHSYSTDIDLSVKTLGICWKPFEDCFVFKQLWQCKLDWDDVLPNSNANEWREFETTLKCIEEVKINRFIMADNVRIVLQGFADASDAVYGAVVYLQYFLHKGAAKVSILSSKSRVAPIRVISIPRLELCACVLLAQLVKKIRSTLRLNISDIVLHTDSTIALAWLNTPANRLKTFVANRVAKVQELTEGFQWNHVPSVLNPADLVSRGLRPCDLPNLRLWWHGPQFLEKGKLSSEETSLSPVKDCEYSKELKTGSSSDTITSSVCVSTN